MSFANLQSFKALAAKVEALEAKLTDALAAKVSAPEAELLTDALAAKVEALEAKLADAVAANAALADRVAFLDFHSAPVQETKKKAKRAALLDRVKAVRTVEDWRGIDGAALAMFNERCTTEQLLEICRPASSEDRAAVLLGVGTKAATVRFEIAPAPQLLEVSSTSSLITRPVELQSADQFRRLKALGLPTAEGTEGLMGVNRYSLKAFTINAGTPMVLDAGAFEMWKAMDSHLAELVDSGRLTVITLDERAAREHAKSVYFMKLALARDDQDSRLAPVAPAI